ncbi:uncharacterized protein LOC107041654 [Diachasma alloeum]|uniref:uncharacterized protein LOC107041654 n=1 Tax=Diachasma alloeum TaxID=454923 RepID=UPI00073820CB|nr:uncharacterized protein LOC107041654 [Diachasma alloeum]
MFSFFLFFISIIISLSKADNPELGTIIFANILYRHGVKTPEVSYPNDPWKNESLWPVPFGELTNLGKQQLLELGKWFRARYNQMLPRKYSPYDIYVRSTDVDRTLMSAQVNLAGLYPPVDDQVFDDELKWMPIPVHTTPEKEDNVLAGEKYCARYSLELKRLTASPVIQNILQDNRELLDYLTKMTGKTINFSDVFVHIYDSLFIQRLYNKTLPAWTSSVYPDKMQPMVNFAFTAYAHTKILQRLRTGLLMKEMVTHMIQKSKSSLVPDRKLFMYAAHDVTVANLLMTLGVFDPHRPPFAATVLMELRLNSKKQHVVTISYKNSSAEPTLLTLPGCTPACPLSQFVNLTKDVIPEDWDKECSIPRHSSSTNGIESSSCLISQESYTFFQQPAITATCRIMNHESSEELKTNYKKDPNAAKQNTSWDEPQKSQHVSRKSDWINRGNCKRTNTTSKAMNPVGCDELPHLPTTTKSRGRLKLFQQKNENSTIKRVVYDSQKKDPPDMIIDLNSDEVLAVATDPAKYSLLLSQLPSEMNQSLQKLKVGKVNRDDKSTRKIASNEDANLAKVGDDANSQLRSKKRLRLGKSPPSIILVESFSDTDDRAVKDRHQEPLNMPKVKKVRYEGHDRFLTRQSPQASTSNNYQRVHVQTDHFHNEKKQSAQSICIENDTNSDEDVRMNDLSAPIIY